MTFAFQAQVSLQRLTDFLSLDEIDSNNVEKTMPEHRKLLC